MPEGFQINYDLSGLRVISDKLREAGNKSPLILKAAVKHTGDKATSAMRSALVGQTGLKRGSCGQGQVRRYGLRHQIARRQ
jgi:hypothetical protein